MCPCPTKANNFSQYECDSAFPTQSLVRAVHAVRQKVGSSGADLTVSWFFGNIDIPHNTKEVWMSGVECSRVSRFARACQAKKQKLFQAGCYSPYHARDFITVDLFVESISVITKILKID